jgi:hypothetical protein
MNDYHHAGAFVVQFRAVTDFECGRVQGRVEHVASGQTAHFESARDLLDTFARLSKSTAMDRQAHG